MNYLKINALVLIVFLQLMLKLSINASPVDSTTERILQEIQKSIPIFNSSPVKINFEMKGLHRAISDSEIAINISRLSELNTERTKEIFDDICAIIVFHEVAHCRQFVMLKELINANQSCEIKAVLEAQADVLSGYYLAKFHSLQGRPFSFSDNADTLQRLLSYVYSIGNYEYALGSHPSFTQRRNSLRLGLGYWFYETSRDENARRKIKESLLIDPDKDDFKFSFEMAKVICHSPNSFTKDILYISNISFDTSKNNPMVYFDERYKNIGDKTLEIQVQIKVIGENRLYNDPLYNDLQGGFKNYRFILKPDKIFRIKDSLNWQSVSNIHYMPLYLNIDENECLYIVKAISNDKPVFDNRCINQKIFASETLRNGSTDIKNALLFLSNEFNSDFEYLRFGVARQYWANNISFKSIFKMPYCNESYIIVNDKFKDPTFVGSASGANYDSTIYEHIYWDYKSQLLQMKDSGRLKFIDEYKSTTESQKLQIGDTTILPDKSSLFLADNYERVIIKKSHIEKKLKFQFQNSDMVIRIDYSIYKKHPDFTTFSIYVENGK